METVQFNNQEITKALGENDEDFIDNSICVDMANAYDSCPYCGSDDCVSCLRLSDRLSPSFDNNNR